MNSFENHMYAIEGFIKNYPWGSHKTLANHRGEIESSEPEAELWFGDNPQGPSRLRSDGRTLDQLTSTIGQGLAMGQLPFLVKILAVEGALSLQVHPALEDIPSLGALCKDKNHKPEMVVALTQFQAFVGFSDVHEIFKRLEAINSQRLDEIITKPLRNGLSIEVILEKLLGVKDVTGVLEEVMEKMSSLDSMQFRWTLELIKLYAPKLDALATVLCEFITLAPGQSIYLPPRCVHAYLNGTVVEVMANSDNVLRGGLTTKPIDKENFLRVIDVEHARAQHISPVVAPTYRKWSPPISDFELLEFKGAIDTHFTIEDFAIAFAWQGGARIGDAATFGEALEVRHEIGAFLYPGRYRLEGSGSVWVATGKSR